MNGFDLSLVYIQQRCLSDSLTRLTVSGIQCSVCLCVGVRSVCEREREREREREMFLDRLERFLKDKCGLEPSQVPKVIGTFIGLKYVVWSGFLVVGARYQPVTRFFVRKMKNVPIQMPKRATDARKAFNDGYIEQKYKITKDAPSSLFVRLGRSYQHHTSILAEKVAANSLWVLISRSIRQDPRYLAVGLAEGLVMYKLMIPIHIPVTLYLLVIYYQQKAERDAFLLQGQEEIQEERIEEDKTAPFETLRGLGLIASQENEESVLDDYQVVQESRTL